MITKDDERRYIIGIVEDGVKSDYWKLLKEVIIEWIEEENRMLDSYKRLGISKDGEIDKYNRSVDRIVYLKKMLMVNETIVGHQRSFIQKALETVNDFMRRGESFFEEVMKK